MRQAVKSFWEGTMKILAMEIEAEGVRPEEYKPHLKAETKRVWGLYQSGMR